jgi:hypothetical protein
LKNFSKRRKSMTWSKNSEFVLYPINLYYEKTKDEKVSNDENETKTVDEEKVTEAEIEIKKKEKKKKVSQSSINGNLPTKRKHYGHIHRMRLQITSMMNFIKY